MGESYLFQDVCLLVEVGHYTENYPVGASAEFVNDLEVAHLGTHPRVGSLHP